MNYVIFPEGSSVDFDAEKDGWVEASGVSLGGCFYDYLRSVNGKIVGVRYWIIENVNFNRHPVYSQFIADKRFVFDQAGGYVDMVFDEGGVDLLSKGHLSVDVVQDFGGEGVLRCGNWFGIFFALAEADDGFLQAGH